VSELISLTDLIGKVRRRTKLERQTELVTNEEVTDYLDERYKEFAEIISSAPQGWLRDSRTFTTTANTVSYPLRSIAPNFFRLINCWVFYNAGSTTDMMVTRPFMEREVSNFFPSSAWLTQQPIYHRMMGKDLYLEPPPPGSISVQVNYIPTLDSLDASNPDSSKIDAINGWDAFLVWGAAADVLSGLSLDPSYQMSRCAEAKQRIVAMVDRRDEGGAETVNDVVGDRWLGD